MTNPLIDKWNEIHSPKKVKEVEEVKEPETPKKVQYQISYTDPNGNIVTSSANSVTSIINASSSTLSYRPMSANTLPINTPKSALNQQLAELTKRVEGGSAIVTSIVMNAGIQTNSYMIEIRDYG